MVIYKHYCMYALAKNIFRPQNVIAVQNEGLKQRFFLSPEHGRKHKFN
jgi:hypothetical protein